VATTTGSTRLARVNGIDLAYQLFGEGDPVVLLHGGFGSVEMFGPNVAALAAGRRVIGVDLQSHGRTPAADRPMRFETMADDIAALIGELGLSRADIMGFSLGGGVALRTAIQHPDVVDRLVTVDDVGAGELGDHTVDRLGKHLGIGVANRALESTPFKRAGWYPEMSAAMSAMGPQVAEPMKQTPMYEVYKEVAPNVDDWPVLVTQLTELLRQDYDWTDEARALRPPTLIVAGDADGLPPRHAVEFFELLGGGQRDASWDRSGMTRHRLAILSGLTHYDINVAPELATTVLRFLGERSDSA